MRAVYQPPSPSRRSGASPAVVTTLCENQNRKASGEDGSVAQSVSETTVESGETRHSSQQIIDKSSILGGGRSKLQWIKSPGLYKVSTAFSNVCKAGGFVMYNYNAGLLTLRNGPVCPTGKPLLHYRITSSQ